MLEILLFCNVGSALAEDEMILIWNYGLAGMKWYHTLGKKENTVRHCKQMPPICFFFVGLTHNHSCRRLLFMAVAVLILLLLIYRQSDIDDAFTIFDLLPLPLSLTSEWALIELGARWINGEGEERERHKIELKRSWRHTNKQYSAVWLLNNDTSVLLSQLGTQRHRQRHKHWHTTRSQ